MGIDVNQTRKYYESIKPEDLCECDYCKNYCLQIREAYPDLTEYLKEMGIDIEKPFETAPLEPDETGMLEYCFCQYIVLGNTSNDLLNRIGDVELGIALSHPATNIDVTHLVIEVYPIKLKWIM